MKLNQNPVGLFVQARALDETGKVNLIQHAKRANYATLSVMDDFALCVRLKNALPDCVVIYRDSAFEPKPSSNNGNAITYYLNKVIPQDKRIVIMVNVEQGFSHERCEMWADMILAAESLGWKLAVGGVSSGSVKCGQGSDPNQWLTEGARLLDVLAHNPGHLLHVHEYTFPFPWSVSNGAWGEPNNPPIINFNLPQWHIGRNCQGLQSACKSLGLDFSKIGIVISENLIDTMNDIVEHFGLKADGWRNLTGKWNEWYPNKNPEDVLADFHIWTWANIYSAFPNVIGTHTYCYANAGNNPRWEPYRVDNAPRYQQRMESYAPPAPVPPALSVYPAFPTDFSIRAVLSLLCSISQRLVIRSKPTTDSDKVVTIDAGGTNGYYIPAAALKDSEIIQESIGGISGVWLPCSIDDKTGWVFSGLLRIKDPLPPAPPAQPDLQAIYNLAFNVKVMADRILQLLSGVVDNTGTDK